MLRHPRTTLSLLIALFVTACHTPLARPTDGELEALRIELLDMQERDQRLEHMVIDQDPKIREPGFFDAKRAQQDRNGMRCRAIFSRYGYPGADMVGAEASEAFWLLVQHADRDPEFQERVATAMVSVVASGNARGQNLAYLTDRVRINTGRKQLYGTQTTFDVDTGRIYPKAMEDPQQVDVRRKQVGLEPLWKYINGATEMHFRMNAKAMRERGITSPPMLPDGYRDW